MKRFLLKFFLAIMLVAMNAFSAKAQTTPQPGTPDITITVAKNAEVSISMQADVPNTYVFVETSAGNYETVNVGVNWTNPAKYTAKDNTIKVYGKLKGFNCSGNNEKITGLTLSGGQTSMEFLDCSGNSLQTLDVSSLKNLTVLDCSYNNLQSLNVSGLKNLKTLYCGYNRVQATDADEPEIEEPPLKNIAGAFTLEKGNVYYIFNDKEPNEVLITRSFDPKNPVQVSITSKKEFLLRSYSPRMLKGMKIWAKLSGKSEEFLLAYFDVLPPFVEFIKELPFIKNDTEYINSSENTIKITANSAIVPKDITLRIECPDPLWAKYQSIKKSGTVKFSNYQWPKHNYWRDIKPVVCREACAMSINAAYMFSSERYLNEMKKFDGKTYGKFINNLPANARNGKIDDMLSAVGPGKAVLVDYNEVINKSQNKSVNTVWGRLEGVGGLGGGNTLGLGGGSFVNHYGDDDGGAMAWFHELGHCMGYGDATNTVVSWSTLGKAKDGKEYFAWRYVCQELYVKMCLDKELPIYSKLFLNSRKNWYQPDAKLLIHAGSRGKTIDIPEEEKKWFGGTPSILVSLEEGKSDPDIDKGNALNFEIDFTAAKYNSAEKFKPHRMAVYGDKLYVLNRVANNDCALDVFDLSSSTPKHEKNIKEIKKGNNTIKLNNVRDVYRSYDKIYINYNNPGANLVLNDKYEYVNTIDDGGTTTSVIASKGFVFGLFRYLKVAIESFLKNDASIIIDMAVVGNGSENNRLTLDKSGNLWAVSYNSKELILINTDQLSKKYKTSIGRKVSFANAKFNPYSVCFVNDKLVVASGYNNNNKKHEIAVFDVSGNQAARKNEFDLNKKIGLSGKESCYSIMGRNTLFVIDSEKGKIIAKPLNSLGL